MSSRVGLRLVTVVALAAGVASGCGDDGASVDKAGGTGEPLTLRLATAFQDLGDLPALQYFVQQVTVVSDGAMRLEVVGEWGNAAPDAEESVVRGVAEGDADLGWAGSRVFDTLGITDFQALSAPMLIDSYALEGMVIESGLTDEMMSSLDEVDVVGLGVLAEGLRKPFAVEKPIVGLREWQGITFATVASDAQAAAISALGATPVQLFGAGRKRALASGEVQGFEFNLNNYARDPVLQSEAPYVTANVNLWPLMSVLFANPDRLSSLTSEQRGWLEEAVSDAADQSSTLVDRDSDSVAAICGGPARFAMATNKDLTELKEAFTPVYATLGKDPTTQEFIDRIRTLKESVKAEVSLPIERDCTGQGPDTGGPTTGSAPKALNGTYRYEISYDEANAAGMVDAEDTYPLVTTIVLEDGTLDGGCFGHEGGTYSADGDQLAFHSAEYGTTSEVTYEQDEDGNLHLTAVPGTDPGDAFQCFSQVWTKIG